MASPFYRTTGYSGVKETVASRKKVRVLCLDAEGGFGGSSRSLFELLSKVDRERFEVEVLHRKDGPIGERYRNEGIHAEYHPEMPRVSSLPQNIVNVFVYAIFLKDWIVSWKWRKQLLARLNKFDHLHLNLEVFFILGWWIKRHADISVSLHVRTNIWNNIFSRCQARILASCFDDLIFITEMEKKNLERLAGRKIQGHIINNPVSIPTASVLDVPERRHDKDKKIIIACISNYAWLRGTDRLIDLALYEAAKGRFQFMFVVAGKTQLSREALRKLGKRAKGCRTLEDFAEKQGVYHYFRFLGFTPNPETILASSDVLIKPTREDNPWGRDILEGMAWGKPVIALGTYNKFVENNMTGFLYSEWDPGLVCAGIHKLIDNPGLVTRMGAEGRNRVSKFCDGRQSARMVESIWGNYNMSE